MYTERTAAKDSRLPTRPAALWAGAAFLALLVHLVTHPPGGAALGGVLPAATRVALPFTIGLARRLAAIQMQADIALHVREARPGQPEEALRAISAASAEALAELRTTLSTIRPDSPGAQGDSRSLTPGVARLDALCDRVRAAGVAVDLEVTDVRQPLPAAVDLAVYRIVQESLTNVVKHATHPRAEVRVAGTAAAVTITVKNRDPLPEDHAPGFGIVGMQRRASQLGGELAHGPGPEPGTFRISAALPLPPEESP